MNDPLIEQLLQALRCLPGVGARTAQRMAVHLLERDRSGGEKLAQTLAHAMREIQRCERCRNFTSHTICTICQSAKRSNQQLCIVEAPADVLAIEQATGFNGLYFVLLGRLSPLDGIGPEQLGLALLEQRLRDEPIEEVIVATNSTVEGEATAHYIASLADRYSIRMSRLAQGVPLGGELEHTDSSTLAHAFAARQSLSNHD
ncbi:MAG: recombination mediator RecR [Pseudomonadota bacterium]